VAATPLCGKTNGSPLLSGWKWPGATWVSRGSLWVPPRSQGRLPSTLRA
jgi:hypothetical protein